MAPYIIFLLALLFIVGIKLVFQEGMNYRNGLVCGVSFWVGTAFQAGAIAPEFFSDFAGGMFENGMTAGGLTAMLMTLFMEWTSPRRHRMQAELGVTALPLIIKFLHKMAARSRWDDAMTNRLEAVSEETLLTLLEQPGDRQRKQRQMLLIARKDGDGVMLEFIAASGDGNVEDRIAHLAEPNPEGAPGAAVVAAPAARPVLIRPPPAIPRHRHHHSARHTPTSRRRPGRPLATSRGNPRVWSRCATRSAGGCVWRFYGCGGLGAAGSGPGKNQSGPAQGASRNNEADTCCDGNSSISIRSGEGRRGSLGCSGFRRRRSPPMHTPASLRRVPPGSRS